MKNIIVLNGSPRKNGNTSELIKAFTEGAESAGHRVTVFFLDKMNINGCKGCFGGGKDAKHPCVQKDDMEQITRKQISWFWQVLHTTEEFPVS